MLTNVIVRSSRLVSTTITNQVYDILIYQRNFYMGTQILCNFIIKCCFITYTFKISNNKKYRFEETNERSTSCKPEQGEKCIGGYARVVTVVKSLLSNRTNPIYLNAGDNFQGTFWYNVGRWNVTSYFLNLLPADAVVNTKRKKIRFP